MVRPAGSGSNHHRYGEVKTRLTIGRRRSPVPQFRKKERGPNLRWSPSTVGALPGMCPNRSSGRDPCELAPRENSHIVGALGVLGDVEAFAFAFDIGTQADDDIDDLVEDRRPDARPHQRGADAPGLRD